MAATFATSAVIRARCSGDAASGPSGLLQAVKVRCHHRGLRPRQEHTFEARRDVKQGELLECASSDRARIAAPETQVERLRAEVDEYLAGRGAGTRAPRRS